MSFRHRILAVLALGGLAPVLLLGWTSLTVNRDELVGTLGDAQARATQDLAADCERFVLEGIRGLSLGAGYLPFDDLSPQEIESALAIPYRQLPWVNIVVLLDEHGSAAVPPVFTRAPAADPDLRGRDAVADEDLAEFAGKVPFEAALAAGTAIGPPYRGPSGGPRLAVAIRVAGASPRVLAAEVSLGEVTRRLAAAAEPAGRAFLVDARGELVADAQGRRELSAAERAALSDGARRASAPAGLIGAGEDRWLAAWAPVGGLGWSVVASRPASVALRTVDRVRRYTLFWAAVALLLTVSLGYVLAQGVSRPVAGLASAARQLTEGRYDARLPAGGRDELGRLAEAFNHMAAEVQRRDEAIRGWNAELERRVVEKTAELRDAQDQIARSRRLAAVGSLGAGVAHTLNNPMMAIVGLVTLVRQRLGAGREESALLEEALGEARRATRVVQDLRRYAEQERDGTGHRFDVRKPVLAAIDAHRAELARSGIALQTQVAGVLPAAQGQPQQIEQLVSHLVDNAIQAMPEGGRLEVSVSAVEGEALKLCIADTGRGIPPEIRDRVFDPFFTTRPGNSTGLGLSLSHSIVESHHGTIRVESEPGRGSRFTIVLPAAAAAPHLA